MNKFDAIVIGGGVIGCAIALEMSKRYKKVLVIEKSKVGSEASSAAAGMLAALGELGLDGGPLFQLATQSRNMFPQLAVELKELTGIDIGLVNEGMLKIPLCEKEQMDYKKIAQIHRETGEDVQWKTNLHNEEPLLGDSFSAGLVVKSDGQVEAPKLVHALASASIKLGTVIKEETAFEQFLFNDEQIVGVKTNNGSYYSEQFIVAAGAWSERILETLGTALPMIPVKGECFSVTSEQPLLKATLFSNGCYIVPKGGNRLLVGATMTEGTYSKEVTFTSLQHLMSRAKALLPEIEKTNFEKAWAGTRPQTADGLPYLGLHPQHANLAIATGHYRNGILLSAITGPLIADLLAGKGWPGIEHFAIDR